MAMRKRKRHRTNAMWILTTDLPTTPSHPVPRSKFKVQPATRNLGTDSDNLFRYSAPQTRREPHFTSARVGSFFLAASNWASSRAICSRILRILRSRSAFSTLFVS
jgi:hypothetical protein